MYNPNLKWITTLPPCGIPILVETLSPFCGNSDFSLDSQSVLRKCWFYFGRSPNLFFAGCELNWTELNWTELNWTELTELNWLNWTDWTELRLVAAISGWFYFRKALGQFLQCMSNLTAAAILGPAQPMAQPMAQPRNIDFSWDIRSFLHKHWFWWDIPSFLQKRQF